MLWNDFTLYAMEYSKAFRVCFTSLFISVSPVYSYASQDVSEETI